jgi:hypothetical protein
LLLTFEMEISIGSRVAFREIIAVMVRPDYPPAESDQWMALGTSKYFVSDESVWDRQFAYWASQGLLDSELMVSGIGLRKHEAFVERFEAMKHEGTARSRHWLRVKTDLLCGAFAPPTGDLFGASASGPEWRFQEDPMTRLISLATCPETPPSKRREANNTLETFQTIEFPSALPGPIVSRPIGMLMLVP